MTNVLNINKSPKCLNKLINIDLKNLTKWLNANKIYLNVSKTEMVLFRPKRKSMDFNLKIQLNGKQLYKTNLVKTSLENSADSYLCFPLALLHSVSYFFFLYQSPSSSLCTVFDSISSSIDEVLSINPSANVFVFGDFNVHHKDWLTYSGVTDKSQTTLLR